MRVRTVFEHLMYSYNRNVIILFWDEHCAQLNAALACLLERCECKV